MYFILLRHIFWVGINQPKSKTLTAVSVFDLNVLFETNSNNNLLPKQHISRHAGAQSGRRIV
jgi:hypothetical protein